jgi:hypothetical protein
MTEKRIFDIKRFSGSKTAMLLNGIVCAVPFVFEHAFLLSWFCFVPYVLSFMKERSELRTNQFIRNSFFSGTDSILSDTAGCVSCIRSNISASNQP